MFNYEYTRDLITSGDYQDLYDINNPNRVDGEDNQIYLANEIEIALPGKIFKVVCNEAICDVKFEVELTTEEQATLNTVVSNHKNNV